MSTKERPIIFSGSMGAGDFRGQEAFPAYEIRAQRWEAVRRRLQRATA